MADDRPTLAEPQAFSETAPLAEPNAPTAQNALADLYEHDVLAWSELQAAALRARQTGVFLDWENLAEEIEDVGKSQYQGCQSHVENIVEHLLKLTHVRSPQDHAHWRSEVRGFRIGLRRRLGPTIRRRLAIELDELQADCIATLQLRELPGFDAEAAAAARERPYTWEQIVDPDWLPEPGTSGP